VDELYKDAVKIGKNAIIESIRTPGEITALRQKGHFVLFAVDAKPEIRYERIFLRNSETDHISFDVFLDNEKREMTTTDPNKQNLAECIRQADFIFTNNMVFNDLYKQIDHCLATIDYYIE
ncbi:MAG: hypothetical protein LBU51_02920, partial [Bacteroidales bacterium]|nr:hypothetical protein [Bacteroidales bacterium]